MNLKIQLLSNSRYRVKTHSRLLQFALEHFLRVEVEHISKIGECAWISYENVTPPQEPAK